MDGKVWLWAALKKSGTKLSLYRQKGSTELVSPAMSRYYILINSLHRPDLPSPPYVRYPPKEKCYWHAAFSGTSSLRILLFIYLFHSFWHIILCELYLSCTCFALSETSSFANPTFHVPVSLFLEHHSLSSSLFMYRFPLFLVHHSVWKGFSAFYPDIPCENG